MILNKRYRKLFSKLLRRDGRPDRLVSPFDNWRITYNDDGESWVERRVFTSDEDETDEDIYNWCWEELAVRIYSPWDCTGQAFTTGFSVVRIKGTNKVMVLHHMALDI